jgi:hypothetical protein
MLFICVFDTILFVRVTSISVTHAQVIVPEIHDKTQTPGQQLPYSTKARVGGLRCEDRRTRLLILIGWALRFYWHNKNILLIQICGSLRFWHNLCSLDFAFLFVTSGVGFQVSLYRCKDAAPYSLPISSSFPSSPCCRLLGTCRKCQHSQQVEKHICEAQKICLNCHPKNILCTHACTHMHTHVNVKLLIFTFLSFCQYPLVQFSNFSVLMPHCV